MRSLNSTALLFYRTCSEVRRAGHLRNGYYVLDPDGADAGDPPFGAYCDVTSGKFKYNYVA